MIDASSPVAFKGQSIEVSGAVAANATIIGPWHDTDIDGTMWLEMSIIASQVGASVSIDISPDITNPAMTISGYVNRSPSAAVFIRAWTSVRCRYWRVRLVNGGNAQNPIEIVVDYSTIQPIINSQDNVSGVVANPLVYVSNGQGGGVIADNNLSGQALLSSSGGNNNFPLMSGLEMYGGAFSGAASATLQGWSKARTCTVFKQVTATAAGNTAVWTPGTGNKFRLLKFKIHISANASLAAAGILTVSFVDNASTITGLTQNFFLPVSPGQSTTISTFSTEMIDLGTFGVLSAAANNVLNVNLSAALSTGLLNINVGGTEE